MWSPPKGFLGLSILREEGAALCFPEHSPEMTLGEASHCQLQNRKITAQNAAFPKPLRRVWRSLSLWGSVPGPAASTYCWFRVGVLPRRGVAPSTLSPNLQLRFPTPHPRPRHLTSGDTITPPFALAAGCDAGRRGLVDPGTGRERQIGRAHV